MLGQLALMHVGTIVTLNCGDDRTLLDGYWANVKRMEMV